MALPLPLEVALLTLTLALSLPIAEEKVPIAVFWSTSPPVPLALAIAPIAVFPGTEAVPDVASAIIPQAVFVEIPPSRPAGLPPVPPLAHSTACAAAGMSSAARTTQQSSRVRCLRLPSRASPSLRAANAITFASACATPPKNRFI